MLVLEPPCRALVVRSVRVRLPKLFPISARPLPTSKRAILGQTETLIIFLFSSAWGGVSGSLRSSTRPGLTPLPLPLARSKFPAQLLPQYHQLGRSPPS